MTLRERYERLRRDYLWEAPKSDKVTLEWSKRMTKSAGMCYYNRKVIRLSTHYHERFPEDIDNTLLHEMIHLLAPGHGDSFRNWLQIVSNRGGEVSRYSRERAVAVEDSKWRYTCIRDGCDFEMGRSRRLKERLRLLGRCPKCRSRILEHDQRDVPLGSSVVSCGHESGKGDATMRIEEIIRKGKQDPRRWNRKDGILALLPEEIEEVREMEFPIHTTSATVEWDPVSFETLKIREGRDVAEDMLMWIGVQHYFTVEDFVREARELGVCKRISNLPRKLVPGKTRLFLAHDEGYSGDAVIFGYVTIEEVEITVNSEDEIPEELRGKVRAVLPEERRKEEERGCGFRDSNGGLYVTAKTEEFVQLDPPVDYNATVNQYGKRFRGVKMINGDALLAEDAPTKELPTIRNERTDTIEIEQGSQWSPEEFKIIETLIDEGPSRAWAFREYSRMTKGARTVHSIESAWYKRKDEDK